MLQLFDQSTQRFSLKTESNGLNGIEEQHLIFYYYLAPEGDKVIEIRKREVNGDEVLIDSITSSLYNGWIKHQVNFYANDYGYQVLQDDQDYQRRMMQ